MALGFCWVALRSVRSSARGLSFGLDPKAYTSSRLCYWVGRSIGLRSNCGCGACIEWLLDVYRLKSPRLEMLVVLVRREVLELR